MTANAPLRHATTLLEISVIMAAIGMLMLASLRLLTQAGQLHAIAVTTATQLRVAESAATRLRHDIGQAVDAQAHDGQSLTLRNGQWQQVRYSVRDKSYLTREVVQDGQIVGRDDWNFGSNLTMHVELQSRTEADSPRSNELGSVHSDSAEQRDSSLARVELVQEADKASGAPAWKVVDRVGSRRWKAPSSTSQERP